MRYLAAYYLVLLYVTVMFKPLIPAISDTWSHSFNEASHIATVHAILGSQHLETELANNASDNTGGKDQSTLRAVDEVPTHTPAKECVPVFSANLICREYTSLNTTKLFPAFISIQAPPPKLAA